MDTDMRLLVAEDEDILQALYGLLLQRWGYQYDLATNGAEAVAYARLRGHEYDLCIMDVHMPKLDGLEATRIIRQEAGDFPILGHSNDESLEQKCVESGMDGFLPKSCDPERLRSAIEALTSDSIAVKRRGTGAD
ncbi:response regulator [Thiohalomonas denitrificans]|uniref:response regulator n=1 Tax=Thiohalomonas denitrificans TaxID=415747 RepID=UPI0026F08DDD|nr:response regulator [Thiohalomonas denitrificans]